MTPSWDNPDTRLQDDATAPEAILEQFTLYYKWLFKPKPSIDPERHLELLRATRIPEHIVNLMDAPLREEELVRAIQSMSKGKAAGPDQLGSEFYHQFQGVILKDLLSMLPYLRKPNTTEPSPPLTLSAQ